MVMVSPGAKSGCVLPVANASSATLIKSIFLSRIKNVNTIRNIHRLHVLPEITKSVAKLQFLVQISNVLRLISAPVSKKILSIVGKWLILC